MQIVTWPSGKAALNIIKRRQQKQTRRQDTGNVFSLLVSSGRSGMIECWCLPGPLQTIVPPPPSWYTHAHPSTCMHSISFFFTSPHTRAQMSSCHLSDKKRQGEWTVTVTASLHLFSWSREYFGLMLNFIYIVCVCTLFLVTFIGPFP